MATTVLGALVAAGLTAGAANVRAEEEADEMPLKASGMTGRAEKLPKITLASGSPLAEKPLKLKAGTYYRIAISADGSAEMAISGAKFFRNCWINEVVINDIEVRPLGLDSIEFDDEGEAEISFIPIQPGEFELIAPGTAPLKISVQ